MCSQRSDYFLAGKIKEIIDGIIQERSKGNPAIAEMTKAKFILKGINPNKFDSSSADDAVIIDKLLDVAQQLNVKELEANTSNIKSVFSIKADEHEAVLDIKHQLKGIGVKLLVFFASSNYDQDRLSNLMQESFNNCVVFGCSTAGEIANGLFLENSVVVMAINSQIISDAKVEVVERMSEKLSVEAAFTSFEQYYNKSSYIMEPTKYVGIVLIDGISMKEEKLMDQIGNRTNVFFIGGSAGDDRKYARTYVYANGKAYTDSAILVLLKMNEQAEFGIIKTQSFKALDNVLIANKVKEETREVIEFNNRPALEAYAEAVCANKVEEAQNYFMTHPVGLIIGENDILVRTPLRKKGTNIQFACNILEGMEVKLLESTNIIKDTKKAFEKKAREFGRIDGLINFQCLMRTLELEKNNSFKQYGEIFSQIPTIGFSTYGEEYIGHINQTSTILFFKGAQNKPCDFQGVTSIESDKHLSLVEQNNQRLIKENNNLQRKVISLTDELEETTAALREFNIMLEEEINERTKREEEIAFLSYHDKLTGLYNRRFYEVEIKRLDTEKNLPISIICGDVNGLKLVNDTFGHNKGDELLRKAAAVIQNACRTGDIAARWGGDEFVLLLPNTDEKEAETIVKKLKAQYINEQVNGISISIAFGWAAKKRMEEDILAILKNAENYMYKHKILKNEGMMKDTISTIINTLHEKNPREEQHSKRVSDLCQSIGIEIGFSEIEVSILKIVGLLHDIGKIAIEEGILNKPEKLTDIERIEIERHPEIGYRILNSSRNLLDIADSILAHHERWDGKGYPKGLKGEAIPRVARIIALADAYDAMTSERSYRSPLPEAIAIEELKKNAGTQFDPELTKIFIEKVLRKQ